ncbi:hypothetical protein ACFVWL_10440 [Microbacterium sp. NPDC058269]|uniref:hypothetical protein n=1 Tax=Microbacterium sp. NPDC058269 TaxID=3346414 RepID=UPI0036DAD851
MAEPVTLASVEQLADWIGESIPDNSAEERRAAMCLRAASALVRKESGRTWLSDTGELVDPLPEDVIMVTLYCASRVFDNREAQIRGGIDDFTEGWKVDEAGAYLTASEKRMLAPFREAGSGGLAVVSTTRRETPAVSGWVPTDTPDVFFPWY